MNWESLIDSAVAARKCAYAPYSEYRVGAAVLGMDGKIYSGCNVENASYGLTICAERNAIFSMVSAGCTKLNACVVVTEDGKPPCGACLQVMSEFVRDSEDVRVLTVDANDNRVERLFSKLLPSAFKR